MSYFGSGENGELTFLDIVSLTSFVIGLENLKLNITADDMDRQTAQFDKIVNDRIEAALKDIHTHLRTQDDMIGALLERTDSRR